MSTMNSDPEKTQLIQKQLVLLLHAHKCTRHDSENRDCAANNQSLPHAECNLPHCEEMKNVLRHLTQCNTGRTCTFQHCRSSRQIIAHWKNCANEQCSVCSPLRRLHDQPNPLTLPNITTIPPVSNQFGQLSVLMPRTPDALKEWQTGFEARNRIHLIDQLVKACCPPEELNENRMKDLEAFARRVEEDLFEVSNDRDEYFMRIAELIHKLKKSTEKQAASRRAPAAALEQLNIE